MMPRVSLQLQQVIATQQSMMLPNASNATDLDNTSMMGMMRMSRMTMGMRRMMMLRMTMLRRRATMLMSMIMMLRRRMTQMGR